MPSSRSHRLHLGDPDSVRVAAARSSAFSVVHWLLDETSRARSSASRPSSTPVARHAIRPAVTALGMPGLDRMPDCIMALDPRTSTIREHVERLRDSSGEELTREVRELWGPTPPPPWRYAAEQPRIWMRSLALASMDVWRTSGSRWVRGQDVLDREVARIGVASVTGSLDVLFNSLHPRLRFRDGSLEFNIDCGNRIELADRRLILVPMLVRSHQVAVSFNGPDFAYVAYPALGNPGDRGEVGSTKDSLALVLGPLRAGALKVLARPRTMRDLARLLHCAPSTATYHCDQLERAGLITRERRTQSVWVARTGRADEMIELLAD